MAIYKFDECRWEAGEWELSHVSSRIYGLCIPLRLFEKHLLNIFYASATISLNTLVNKHSNFPSLLELTSFKGKQAINIRHCINCKVCIKHDECYEKQNTEPCVEELAGVACAKSTLVLYTWHRKTVRWEMPCIFKRCLVCCSSKRKSCEI